MRLCYAILGLILPVSALAAGRSVGSNLDFIATSGSITAGAFIGDGSHLTGFGTSFVQRVGDSMSGPLNMVNSTITIGGNAFSVGGSTFTIAQGTAAFAGPYFSIGKSTFVVSNGRVGIGKSPSVSLDVNGAVTASGLVTAGSASGFQSGAMNLAPGTGIAYNAGGLFGAFSITSEFDGSNNADDILLTPGGAGDVALIRIPGANNSGLIPNGPLLITAGAGSSSNGAAVTISGGATGGHTGGAVNINGGTSSQAGGGVILTAGSGVSSTPGAVVTLNGGASASGGAISITGGIAGSGSFNGGGVAISAGASDVRGGATIAAGGGTQLLSGNASVTGGNSTSSSYNAGNATIAGGNASGPSGGNGGNLILAGGTSIAGSTGSVIIGQATGFISTFSATGSLALANNAFITGNSSITASAFFGDGSHLTGVLPSADVPNTIASSFTIQGAGGLAVTYGVTAGSATIGPVNITATSETVKGNLSVSANNSLYVGDVSNSYSTEGLTVNQNAATDEIFTLKSSWFASGLTGDTQTNSYGVMRPISGTNGGVSFAGYSAADAIGMRVRGILGTNIPSKPAVMITAGKKSGASVVNIVSTETAVQFTNNDGTTIFETIMGNGSLGIGTTSPVATLEVNGNAQFGSGAAKSTFTATGALNLAGNGIAVSLVAPGVIQSSAVGVGFEQLTNTANAPAYISNWPGAGSWGLGTGFNTNDVKLGPVSKAGGGTGVWSAATLRLDVEGSMSVGVGATKSSFTTTGALTLDPGAALTVSSASFMGLHVSTQAAGAAGASVTALCLNPASGAATGYFATGGGCNCSGGVAITGTISVPNSIVPGSVPTGWTCQEPGGTGGACSAYALCSRIQ